MVEALARWIAGRLGMPFEDIGAEEGVFFGWMPDAPVRAVCVTADGLRSGGEGSRVQAQIRSDLDGDWALRRGEALVALLDEARDLMPSPEGPVIRRVTVERGLYLLGLEGNHTQVYGADFIVYAE